MGQAVQRKFDAAQFEVRASSIGMALQGGFQWRHGIFGLALAEEEDAVVDSRIFIRSGVAIAAQRLSEGTAGFGGLAERFERKCQQPVGFAVLGVPLQHGMQHIDRRLKAIQQIKRAAIVKAGIGQGGRAFTSVTERSFGELEFLPRCIDHTQRLPGLRVRGTQSHCA